MLKLVAFSEPFFGLMVVSQGIYYGLGKTHYSFIIEAFGMWGVRILFTFLLHQYMEIRPYSSMVLYDC